MKIIKKESERVKMSCVCGCIEKIEKYKLQERFIDGDDGSRVKVVGYLCANCFDNVAVYAEGIS